MVIRRIAQYLETEMRMDVSDGEIETVLQAKVRFESTAKALKMATEHLDHIYDPFTEHTDISVESIVENRGVLQGRYSTRVKENFNKMKSHALLAIQKFNTFSTGDQNVRELITTFTDSIGGVEAGVEVFLDILKNDYKSPDFREKVIEAINKVKKEAGELGEFIDDTIIENIDRDFLKKTWMNDTSDEMSLDMDEVELPLVTRLREERDKTINPEAFPAAEGKGQELNMSDSNRMLHPGRMESDTSTGV